MKFTTLAMIGAAAGQAAENPSTNKCNRAGDCGKFPDTSCAMLDFSGIPMPKDCDQTCVNTIIAWGTEMGVDKAKFEAAVTAAPDAKTWAAGMEVFNEAS